jgi:dihydrodipicolinate synthase/N-acetylneuraminate lyase
MVTPVTPAGEIDTAAVKRIVDHLVAGGSHGIFPLGTTGEASSLSTAQRDQLVTATVKAVAGRAMVYAGISANSFGDSIDAAERFAQIGLDALVAHPPCYYPLTDQQIEAYLARLADRVSKPLVLYNIPQTTHLSIPIDAITRLAKHDNVAAIKDSSPDGDRIAALLEMTGGRGGFPVLLGNSLLFSRGLKLGGVGLVPSGAHLAPREYRQMFDAAMAGEWDVVEKLQTATDAVCSSYGGRGKTLGQSLALLKFQMEQRGLCSRTMLPPLTDHAENA